MSSVFLRGKTPQCFESEQLDRLTTEQIAITASCLTYSALRLAAAGYLALYQSLGYKPSEAIEALQQSQSEGSEQLNHIDGETYEQDRD